MKGIFLSVFAVLFVFCLVTASALPVEQETSKRDYGLADILQDLYKNENNLSKRSWWGCEDNMMDFISFQHCMKKRNDALSRFRREISELSK